jgi:hypothetical protein
MEIRPARILDAEEACAVLGRSVKRTLRRGARRQSGRLEATARERGAKALTLLSAETARRFYLSAHYMEQGPAAGRFGASSAYPMAKSLVAEPMPD